MKATKKATKKARVLVKDYDAITLNVRDQDAIFSNIEKRYAAASRLQMDLAQLLHDEHADPEAKDTADELKRLIALAKQQVKTDGYAVKNEHKVKNGWSTVSNTLLCLLNPEAEVMAEGPIEAGKPTTVKMKAGDLAKTTPRKVNNSAARVREAVGQGDKRNTNAPKPKAKRSARLPESGKKQGTDGATNWDATFTALGKNAEARKSFVQSFAKNFGSIEIWLNRAGYSAKLESVVPVVKAKPSATKKRATKKAPAAKQQRSIPVAALKKVAARKAAAK